LPAIGKHTAELLQSLGYSEAQIAEWRSKGMIK
jgi:crotonobetainyl-CoA:carnitine CoA-transferase CaiB-like acyl-CoA transferase